MKALSIMPQYADAIAAGEKTEEYRKWQTDYRGDLLICASTRGDKFCVKGHAICVVELRDITWDAKEKVHVWHLRNVRMVYPFPVKGKLHLYDVPDSEIELWKDEDGRQITDKEFDFVLMNWYLWGLIAWPFEGEPPTEAELAALGEG